MICVLGIGSPQGFCERHVVEAGNIIKPETTVPITTNEMGQLSSYLFLHELFCVPGSRHRAKNNDETSQDKFHIESAIYAVSDTGALYSAQHIVCRFAVSFTLSKPLFAESLESDFCGVAFVKNPLAVGQDSDHSATCVKLHWDLWKGQNLDAGKRYVFEAIGCLPSNAPRSFRTRNGGFEYGFRVRFRGTKGRCSLRPLEKSIRVFNPYLNNDAPPDLSHEAFASELIGATVDMGKEMTAFIQYPDQCYDGRNSCKS
jgi:hypothetical protein